MSIYSDLNQQDPLNDVKLTDLEAIYQSIDNIIFTEKGERMFLPEFGTSLAEHIFDPMTRAHASRILYDVVASIREWEPRVLVLRNKSSVQTNPDSHKVVLEIVFVIKGLDRTEYVYQTDLSKNKKGEYFAV